MTISNTPVREGGLPLTHIPDATPVGAMLLTHGAGGNANAPILIAAATELARLGLVVRRYNLPYRQARPSGPPRPAEAVRDREGLRLALSELRVEYPGPVYLGGHSYGGRQASMLAAEDAAACDGLLLQSYPLHPPGQPAKLRTAHLGDIARPAMFVHGTKDPFGTIEEMESALALIPAPHQLYVIDKAGHDLGRGRDLGYCAAFLSFLAAQNS
ncbi:MAG: alpha/beta family hydrolase [Bryobacteraceae bacterium]